MKSAIKKMVHPPKKKKKKKKGSEVNVISCGEDKGEKTCFRWTAFMRDYYISAYKSRMPLMELDFVPNEPRMKAKLRVMMTEL